MIVPFFFSDANVTAELSAFVEKAERICLITVLKGPRDVDVSEQRPFAQILSSVGPRIDLVLVIDEGLPDGMWRDPMGALCDKLFPERGDASAATAGWVVTTQGMPLTFFRKALWDPLEDAETLTAYFATIFPVITPFRREKPVEPAPPPKPRRTVTPIINTAAPWVEPPGYQTPPLGTPAFKTDEIPIPVIPTPGEAPPPVPDAALEFDAWEILGVEQGSTFEVVKKAYRGHMVRYHPDKVASLAPQIREEAESKARDLNVAFDFLKRKLNP